MSNISNYENSNQDDSFKTLKSKCPKNPVISYININSIRTKFNELMDLVGKNVDFLAISETKLDQSFPINQFTFSSFKKPYRLDVNARQGGIMVLVNSNIPSRQINISCLPKDIQQISIELNYHKHK